MILCKHHCARSFLATQEACYIIIEFDRYSHTQLELVLPHSLKLTFCNLSYSPRERRTRACTEVYNSLRHALQLKVTLVVFDQHYISRYSLD